MSFAAPPRESRTPAPRDPRARAPRRPLFQLALALAIGAAFGIQAAPSRELLALAVTAAGAAWLAWSAARPPGDREDGGRARSAPFDAGFLVLVALLSALRALPEHEARWSPELTAWEGAWRPRSEDDSAVRGTLAAVGPGASTFELPRGSVREGERIRILRGAPPAPPVRGPWSAPRTLRADATGANGANGSNGVDGAEETSSAPRIVQVEADEILRLATPRARLRWIERLRARLERRAAELDDPLAASLARAFLLGDSSALDPATADLFTRNGLRHVLAVSGWHVAMMAWLIVRPFTSLALLLASRFPRRRSMLAWLSLLASAGLCLAYVPLTGGGAPVRRSAIAVALAATAAFWPRGGATSNRLLVHGPRRVDALSLWSTALCIECWLDPLAVSEVAVQLSYAATLGLILATQPLSACLATCLGLELRAGPREVLHGWLRQCAAALVRKAARLAITGVAASVAAVVATAPIVWLTFGEACPWGLLTTPLLASLFVALFATGMAMLAAPFGFFAALFTLACRALIAVLAAVDRLPGTPALLPDRPAWLLWLALLLGWLALRARPFDGLRGERLRGATALAAAALLLPWTPCAAGLELHVLEVGHGTCVVFRAPGEPCWIFDCGSRDRSRVAQEALAPILRKWEVDHPSVVLSHTDNDHAGGLRWVLERSPPSLWAGALTAPLAERLPHTCQRLDLSSGALELPERAPDLGITLLRGSSVAGNEGSRSLLLRADGAPVLLCGDAEEAGLAALLREGALASPGGALLAPHHGSAAGCVGALLQQCKPARVWVSCSTRPAVAAELDRRRIPWQSTARDGPISWRPP